MQTKGLPYFKSNNIPLIQALIKEELEPIKLKKSNKNLIKETFFNIFLSERFIQIYKNLGQEIATHCFGNPEDTCLQLTPTPRIFFSGSHGTSMHCDYWYGHGNSVYTTWVPILNCIPGSTFYSDHYNEFNYDINEKKFDLELFENLEKKINKPNFAVLPPKKSSYIFPSSVLHASPLNETNRTRLSFDFRISKINDITSNKFLTGYFKYDNIKKNYQAPKHPLLGKTLLKYICGGIDKDPFYQHICLDAFAKRYGLILTEQEAEIERHGHPILEALLKGHQLKNNFDAIIITSSKIIEKSTLEVIKKSNLKVWSAMENKFIN